VLGWQTRVESVHLTFGILLHGARERYDHRRSAGDSHDDALDFTLAWVLCSTWNRELHRPWLSDHRTKNRLTLVRTVVWYLDEIAENDPLVTVQLANGKPAVELSFSFDSGFRTNHTDEAWTLCGHMDRIARLNDVPYVVDIKSTEHTLDPSFFSKFSPDNQFSLYTAAGRVVFHEPIRALIVDGVQVAAGFSRFMRGLVPRDEHQIDEWLADTRWWLGQMENCAAEAYWPQNDKSCGIYGGCQFRAVCSRSPVARDAWLQTDYKHRMWDPLQRRGDI
jgi:hypothetical protein